MLLPGEGAQLRIPGDEVGDGARLPRQSGVRVAGSSSGFGCCCVGRGRRRRRRQQQQQQRKGCSEAEGKQAGIAAGSMVRC